MTICFEGPSAVGKTTMCEQLHPEFLIIPEVNILFKRPITAEKFWYCKKQIERSIQSSESEKNAILDGDVFQPFWYNWSYGFPKEFLNLEDTFHCYLQGIKDNKLKFPDLYIVFTISKEELIKRKENDFSRQRRNFEKHLTLIDTQRKYFEFLKKDTKIKVEFIEYGNLTETKNMVLEKIQSHSQKHPIDEEKTLNIIYDWLKNNTPTG